MTFSKKDGNFRSATNGWKLTFDPARALLTCRHAKTRAVLGGTLSFVQHADGKEIAWSVVLARDGIPQRLSLVDPQGNAQGYVAIATAPHRIELRLVQRAFAYYQGVLTFAGSARLGTATFACRTTPRPGSAVVQMASGPADSALNDSLFDARSDTLLHFAAETVRILHVADAAHTPGFNVRLTARPENTACAAFVFEVYENYYRSRYVPHYRPIDRKRCPSPPTGWMSWNVYFDQAGEKENLDEARVGAQYLRPFGLETWSIESWQANSHKLPVSEFYNLTLEPHPRQFPHGMQWLARQIKMLGFKPGIWTVPFGTGSHEFYQAHKDWFLHDAQGKPLANWCGLYLLDPSQSRVRQHMRDTHRTMSRDWGYEFFKIDGMSGSGHYSAHFYEHRDVQAAFRRRCAKPFAECIKALRAGIGYDRIFLACGGHSTGPEVAFADAARIGGDIVHANQPPTWEGLTRQSRATLAQFFVHNLAWYNDPDTLLVCAAHSMSAARVATTIVALPGQVMFAGDKLGELPPDRMRLIQQALPVCDVRPLDLFPISDVKTIWDLKIARPFAAWDVVSVFNWTDAMADMEFAFADLGLATDGKYLVFEFWEQKFLGEFSGRFRATLAPRSSLLLAIHPALGRPQFLSTDRHITQGGTCLCGLCWDAKHNVLNGTTELVADNPHCLFFHVPDGFTVTSVQARGATVAASPRQDNLLTVTLKRRTSGTVDWRIRFSKRVG
ncbi:MAG: alpha-galactosidase [Kiritimatiellaeota bacterium]|nr:alpha-galactosidase [Kiritimatiellota bacterium]